ncbi:MAG: ATP-binding cassette domain-containing protein [Coriobacteriia bacterium]|nr:ATP-binding cassette domain-containing protein [Coriobacteriia bacterium]
MVYAIEAHDLRKSFPLKVRKRAGASGVGDTGGAEGAEGAGGDAIAASVEAVRGVTLYVAAGEVFGFLGPNGAGKTTCQRMLTTLLSIDSGSAQVAGYDVSKNPHEVRQQIGYISQLGGADLPATGRENLRLTGRLYGLAPRQVEQKIAQLSRLLSLDELLDRKVRTYSGGQKRRLEIALGIIHEPQVLFMDEPTTGLDPQNRLSLWQHISKLREGGMTIFLTTHYLDEADQLADRLAIIDHGQIVAEGTPAALKGQVKNAQGQQPTLDDVFFEKTGRSLRDISWEDEK